MISLQICDISYIMNIDYITVEYTYVLYLDLGIDTYFIYVSIKGHVSCKSSTSVNLYLLTFHCWPYLHLADYLHICSHARVHVSGLSVRTA